MKVYEDNLMDMPVKVNKNSYQFDKWLLSTLIGKVIPIQDFEKEMKKIFRKKSSCKLWWDNKLINDFWSDMQYHTVNYRCCPSSHKARYIFGLYLEYGNDENITIKEGWLQSV